MAGERHYVSAPVTGEQIHGWFEFVDHTPLSPEQEDRLALDSLSQKVFRERAALWLNPETDSRRTGAKAFNQPLEVDGKAVRFVEQQEAAIFPPREQSAA